MKKHITSIIFTLFVYAGYAQTPQNSLHFDGSDDYVQTSYGGIQGTNPRTVECWIKTPFVSGQEVITDWGTYATGQRFTFALINGRLRVEVFGSGVTSPTVVADTQWHHVAVTYDPNSTLNYRTYIDGVRDSAFNITTAINTGSSVDLRIGLRVDNTKPFSGNIDEVRVWNYARSQALIDSFKDTEICQSASGLVAYYRFNQGNAGNNNSSLTTLNDNSASSNSGALNNFALGGSTSNWVSGASIPLAPNTDTTFSVEACGSYTSPGGQYTLFSKTITDYLTNSAGCDSVLTINVTIKSNSFIYDTATACDSFRTAKGVLKTNSQIYNEVFTNMDGCDSTVQTLLTVNYSDAATINPVACNAYTSPSGNYTWTSTNTYYDTLATMTGCDSVITINLTVNQNSTANLDTTVCDLYTAPSSRIILASGTYVDTIANASNCDSLITINLVVNKSADTTVFATACDSFVSTSGLNTWYSSGNYNEFLETLNGCDSQITYSLIVNYSTEGPTIDTTICSGAYISPKGDSYSESTQIFEMTQNSKGCDSAYQINLTIHTNETVVIQSNDSLIMQNAKADKVQWYNCNTFSDFVAATDTVLVWKDYPGVTNFGARVTNKENRCTDSVCIEPVATGTVRKLSASRILIIPNPASNHFIINTLKTVHYDIYNAFGLSVASGETNQNQSVSIEELVDGMYWVYVNDAATFSAIPLIILRR